MFGDDEPGFEKSKMDKDNRAVAGALGFKFPVVFFLDCLATEENVVAQKTPQSKMIELELTENMDFSSNQSLTGSGRASKGERKKRRLYR